MSSSSKGVSICVVKPGATGTTLAATAATKAKPAVITVAATTGLADGDVITLAADSTGLESIDGKTWVVKVDANGTDFELVGSDTTNDVGTFSAGGSMTAYSKTDMECMCFSEFSFNREEPSVIATGTYCNPNDAIASAAVAAGSVSFAGYIDITDASYKLLLESEGKDMIFRITFPNNGYIIVPVTIDSITWEIPLDGALSYSGTGTMKTNPRHLF